MARRNAWVWCSVLGAALLVVGCGNAQKDATEAAINAAQTAISTVQAEASKYVPDQLEAAQAAVQSAKDTLAKGDYQSALRAAQDSAHKARELAVAAAAKKEEWTKSWQELNETLPKSMDAVKRKLEAYARGAHMPEGLDQDKLAEAKAEFERAKQRWEDARAAAAQGNLGEALQKATGINDVLAKLKEMLGIKP